MSTALGIFKSLARNTAKLRMYWLVGYAALFLINDCWAGDRAESATPFDRTGVPWPSEISAGADFRHILDDLGHSARVATGSGANFPCIWDAQVDQLLPGQKGWLGFNRSGEYVVWRSSDQQTHPIPGEIIKKLQNAPLGGPIRGVVLHKNILCGVAIVRSVDPKTQVPSGSRLMLIDLDSGTVVEERAFESEAFAAASPSGRQFAVLLPVAPLEGRMMSETSGAPPADEAARREAGSALRIFNPDDITKEFPISAHLGVGCKEVGFSPDEKLLWSRDSGETIRVFSLPDGHRVGGLFKFPPKSAVAIADGGRLIVGFAGELRVYDIKTGARIAQRTNAHFRQIAGLAVRPGGEFLASIGQDGVLRTWTLPELSLLSERDVAEASLDAGHNYLCFITPDLLVATHVEYTSEPKPIMLYSWQGTFLAPDATLYTPGRYASAIALSPDATYLAIADQAQGVTFYDNRSAHRIKTVRSPMKECWSISVPFNHPTAVIGSYSGQFAFVSSSEALPPEATPDRLPNKALPMWSVISVQTKNGVFCSSKTLDWICTFNGREIRGGQLGFPRGTPQPLGWLQIGRSEYCAAIGYNWALIYSPEQQKIVHVYRFTSPARHGVYDPLHCCILVSHDDGTIRRWQLPKMVIDQL